MINKFKLRPKGRGDWGGGLYFYYFVVMGFKLFLSSIFLPHFGSWRQNKQMIKACRWSRVNPFVSVFPPGRCNVFSIGGFRDTLSLIERAWLVSTFHTYEKGGGMGVRGACHGSEGSLSARVRLEYCQQPVSPSDGFFSEPIPIPCRDMTDSAQRYNRLLKLPWRNPCKGMTDFYREGGLFQT